MRNAFTIAARELTSYFTSPMAYVAMLFFLGLSGLIFLLYTVQMSARAEMGPMFGSMCFLILLMAPVITMGLLAQETSSGTYELLMTRPVRDVEVVVGKFLGAAGLYALILVISLEFPILYEVFGEPDWGEIAAGYIGLLMAGLAFIAVGVFASSLTSNQIAAWLMGTFMLLLLWLIGWVAPGGGGTGGMAEVFKSISAFENFGDFAKGIVDAKNVLYYLTVIVFFLFMTVRTLESRRTVS